MAHGRVEPDLVMTTRYVGMSHIRAVSSHEVERTSDGSSAIDPKRSHMNRVMYGPDTQQKALDELWSKGVKRPAAQAERPFIQMVLGASSSFFRDEGQVAGEWRPEKLKAWIEKTMKWLFAEFGDDLTHASLHLDESAPHMHVLVVPTYEKKPRTPGRKRKDETQEAFEARKLSVASAEMIRAVGRASSPYWKRPWARREARKSYHRAVRELGLGYGRDFIEEGKPSPKRVPTGTWVKQKAAELSVLQKELEADREAARMDRKAAALDRAAASQERTRQDDCWREIRSMEDAASRRLAENEATRRELEAREKSLQDRERQLAENQGQIIRVLNMFNALGANILERLGEEATGQISLDFAKIVSELMAPLEAPESGDQDPEGPGF